MNRFILVKKKKFLSSVMTQKKLFKFLGVHR